MLDIKAKPRYMIERKDIGVRTSLRQGPERWPE